jgi:hypothetical protein
VGSDQGKGSLTVSAGIIDRNISRRERPVDPGEPSGHPERVCGEIGAKDERQLRNEREDLKRDRVHVHGEVSSEESGPTLVGVRERWGHMEDIHENRTVAHALDPGCKDEKEITGLIEVRGSDIDRAH